MTTFASDTEPPQESKAPPRSARRRAREFVLQGLYQWRVGANRSLRTADGRLRTGKQS